MEADPEDERRNGMGRGGGGGGIKRGGEEPRASRASIIEIV